LEITEDLNHLVLDLISKIQLKEKKKGRLIQFKQLELIIREELGEEIYQEAEVSQQSEKQEEGEDSLNHQEEH
jgi:hypothetical protein